MQLICLSYRGKIVPTFPQIILLRKPGRKRDEPFGSAGNEWSRLVSPFRRRQALRPKAAAIPQSVGDPNAGAIWSNVTKPTNVPRPDGPSEDGRRREREVGTAPRLHTSP